MKARFRRFMEGRYGTDKLNMAVLTVGLVLSVVGMFLSSFLRLSFTLLAYLLLGIALFRCLSRNVYRRYRENLRFLMVLNRFRDKAHKYYVCPRCRQPVRVPKGKGKIAISCPKCQEKFIRKT